MSFWSVLKSNEFYKSNKCKRSQMEFLKNIAINLKATGPAAVIIAWILGVALVGVMGQGETATKALNALNIVGPLLIIVMGQKVP